MAALTLASRLDHVPVGLQGRETDDIAWRDAGYVRLLVHVHNTLALSFGPSMTWMAFRRTVFVAALLALVIADLDGGREVASLLGLSAPVHDPAAQRVKRRMIAEMVPGLLHRIAHRHRRLTANHIAKGPDVRSAGDFVWPASLDAPSPFARRTMKSL